MTQMYLDATYAGERYILVSEAREFVDCVHDDPMRLARIFGRDNIPEAFADILLEKAERVIIDLNL